MTKKRLLLALVLSCGIAGAAQAQQSPTATWNDSVDFRNPYERTADLDRARAQQQARQGGFGPGNVTTTYNGDVTNNGYSTYNGAVTNNQATTATNLNSFSSSLNQQGGSTAAVTFTTGNTAWNTSQNATATSANSGSGAATNNVGSANN